MNQEIRMASLALLSGPLLVAACDPLVLDLGSDRHATGAELPGAGGHGGGGACTPGATASCYDGPPGTGGVGLCKAGTKVCNADGMSYGACMGEVTPKPEDCATPFDEDCDGMAPACKGKLLWARGFGEGGTQNVYGLAIDGSGNLLVTGAFSGTLDMGGGPLVSAGAGDAFLAKLDRAGNHVWSKSFGGDETQRGTGVAVDPSGSVTVVGSFLGNIDLGGGALASTGSVNPAIFVARFDPGGNHLWSQDDNRDFLDTHDSAPCANAEPRQSVCTRADPAAAGGADTSEVTMSISGQGCGAHPLRHNMGTQSDPPAGPLALADVCRIYRRYVLGIVALCNIPEADWEDVTQNVFIIVTRTFDRHDPRTPFKPWLKTIAWRAARDFLERNCNRRERLASSPDGMEVADAGPSPAHSLVMTEAQRGLLRVLGSLDEARRDVYWMHEIEGDSLEEIAERLDANVGTVSSRLHRAKLDVEAAMKRLRATEARTSGLRAMPAFLLDPAALVSAWRDAAGVVPEGDAQGWGAGLGTLGASRPLGDSPAGWTGLGAGPGVASVSAGVAVAHVVACLVVGVGTGAGAMYLAMRPDLDRALPVIAREERPRPAEPVASGTAEPPPRARVVSEAGANAVGTVAPSASRAGARDEQSLLTQASRAITAGHPETAMSLLDHHARRFPRGWLSGAREDLRRRASAEIERQRKAGSP